ncbi:MAG: photosystem reaction center subunit H [Cyanothece sp. SIO1E1]|nr:photosystem reaction center subunit H [Cyanothece sp. SIO1E1]
MTSEHLRQRSDIMGTQVITRDTGKRLGVISQLWVDIDRREVVALGLRESMLSGVLSSTQQIMQLSSIRQIGDVILVDDDTVIEDDLNIEPYSNLINSEVITEAGELLGKVRGFKFDVMDGKVVSLVIASLGIPQIPDQVISTYELPIDEIVSSGPDRLIVFEGAEQKLVQVTVGVLERMGIGNPPWERDEDDNYIMPTSTSNQLGTGLEVPARPMRSRTPAAQETWDEDNWEETESRRFQEPRRQRQPEPAYYDDEEADNWNDAPPAQARQQEPEYEPDYDVNNDVWTDDESQPYKAPPVNIPQKKKVVEYEEEPDY